MSYSKEDCFNLALSALLLSREVQNADTDNSREVKTLRQNWPIAYNAALADMALESTSALATLELVTADPNNIWYYAYKYPSVCAQLLRIESYVRIDNEKTRIPKSVGIWNGQKVIFCNEDGAVARIIPNNIPFNSISAQALHCIALRLAWTSASLIVGKGAAKLKESIYAQYKLARAEAQQQDALENFDYVPDEVQSTFVDERTS